MRNEIHIFGGQGSPGLFHEQSLAVVRKDARSSRFATELLAGCHASLIQDCLSLCPFDSNDEAHLPAIIQAFPSLGSLLSPPAAVRSDPIIEGITLCLYQLLRFLGEIVDDRQYKLRRDSVLETIGFCSGILPAVVVAASETPHDFVKNGIAAFRIAFWIGYRAGQHSRSVCEDDDQDDGGCWTWTISGPERQDISERIHAFNKTVSHERNIR